MAVVSLQIQCVWVLSEAGREKANSGQAFQTLTELPKCSVLQPDSSLLVLSTNTQCNGVVGQSMARSRHSALHSRCYTQAACTIGIRSSKARAMHLALRSQNPDKDLGKVVLFPRDSIRYSYAVCKGLSTKSKG